MSNLMRRAILLVLLLAGFGLVIIVLRMTNHPTVTPAIAKVEPAAMASYLVAAQALPAGTLVRDGDFRGKPVLASQMPSNVIPDTPDTRLSLRGALVRQYIDIGAVVAPGDILRPRDRGFVAAVLGNGYRAVSVGVDQVSGVAGLIWPGDHVDLMLTQPAAGQNDAHEMTTETVLTDVRVIAIDQDMVQSTSGSAAGKLVRTVTLEVTPNQAQVVAVASAIGKLSLDICPAVGTQPVATGVTSSTSIVPPVPPVQPVPAVTVWNGKDASLVRFPKAQVP